jgi:uncharacterized phage-associated protein
MPRELTARLLKPEVRIMADVLDVAAFVLERAGGMTAMKLQKLVYYAQAWSLVWEEGPLFGEPIEAWANGPVCPALYRAHQGRYTVGRGDIPGNPDALNDAARETIDVVLEFYGSKSAQWLSDLSHTEDPWREARRGLAPGQRGNAEITHAAMAEYYGSL